MEHAKPSVRRCAAYTRKFSEEGLEQDFNSLHAQREACEAFIRSQQGEGWRLVRTAYDDADPLVGGLREDGRDLCAPPSTCGPASLHPGRLRLSALDRLLWIWLYRVWPPCVNIMLLVKPATVVQWHRQGFRLYWRCRSRSGRPSVAREVRELIRQMNRANPLWGAPRIHGELLKLGIGISQATVAKYMLQ
jgi:hypothetical protein